MICGKFYLGLEKEDEISNIRKSVFFEEQKLPSFSEIDEIDETAVHAIAYMDFERTNPVGSGRLYRDFTNNKMMIGRIAVLSEERGKGYGEFLVRMLLDKAFQMGAKRVIVNSQKHAVSFYEKIGFQKTGNDGVEDEVRYTVLFISPEMICRKCQTH